MTFLLLHILKQIPAVEPLDQLHQLVRTRYAVYWYARDHPSILGLQ